jgi:predicted dehydrogenase
LQQARGFASAGGFKVVAVADLIPSRREKFRAEQAGARDFATAEELIKDPDIDAVGICLPNDLHAPIAAAALRFGKHVLCEFPPAATLAQCRQIERAAGKSQKVLLYAAQRRFGASELAARQAITKQFAGDVYHVRATWMRTRGMPRGTGWYTDKSRSGGGALIDLGAQMLDLAWHLLGQPKPTSAYGVAHRHFSSNVPEEDNGSVDDAAFALLRFENGKSIELAASWAINQAPQQQGAICRAYGTLGAVEVYTPTGAMLYRHFDAKGQPKPSPLPGPKITGYTALARHIRECILGKTRAIVDGAESVRLMQMIEAIYRSSEDARSIAIK